MLQQHDFKNASQNIYDFIIDTTFVQAIESDTYTSYTFIAEKDSTDNTALYNYIVTFYNDDRVHEMLVRYPLISTDSSDLDMTNIFAEPLAGDLSILPKTGCTDGYPVTSWDSASYCIPYNCGLSGDHSPGQACDDGTIRSGERCFGSWVTTCSPNTEFDLGDSGGGGTNGGGDGDEDDIAVMPLDECKKLARLGLDGDCDTINNNEDECLQSDEYFNSSYSLGSPFSVDLSEVRPLCDDSIDTSEVEANEKFMCVYKILTELNSFKNILNNVSGNSEVFNVKFIIEENLSNSKNKPVKGLAFKNDETNYTIKLDKFVMENHSLLFIANLIIHESIHANLYARASLETNANLHNEFINNQDYDYEEAFLLYYYANLIVGDDNWQHNFMANSLLTQMGQLSEEFHNSYPDLLFREFLGTDFDFDTMYKDLSISGSLRTTNYFKSTYTNNFEQSIV